MSWACVLDRHCLQKEGEEMARQRGHGEALSLLFRRIVFRVLCTLYTA